MTDQQPPEHLRHKPLTNLSSPRELILACPSFKSKVNLSRIVRLAGCAAHQIGTKLPENLVLRLHGGPSPQSHPDEVQLVEEVSGRKILQLLVQSTHRLS